MRVGFESCKVIYIELFQRSSGSIPPISLRFIMAATRA